MYIKLIFIHYFRSKKYLESFPENIIVLRKIDQLTKNFCMTYVMVKGAETHIQERVTKIVEQATEVNNQYF